MIDAPADRPLTGPAAAYGLVADGGHGVAARADEFSDSAAAALKELAVRGGDWREYGGRYRFAAVAMESGPAGGGGLLVVRRGDGPADAHGRRTDRFDAVWLSPESPRDAPPDADRPDADRLANPAAWSAVPDEPDHTITLTPADPPPRVAERTAGPAVAASHPRRPPPTRSSGSTRFAGMAGGLLVGLLVGAAAAGGAVWWRWDRDAADAGRRIAAAERELAGERVRTERRRAEADRIDAQRAGRAAELEAWRAAARRLPAGEVAVRTPADLTAAVGRLVDDAETQRSLNATLRAQSDRRDSGTAAQIEARSAAADTRAEVEKLIEQVRRTEEALVRLLGKVRELPAESRVGGG